MEKSKELAQALLEVLEENLKLKVKINKAIEYIHSHREAVDERNSEILYWLTDDFDEEDILEILGDQENDR